MHGQLQHFSVRDPFEESRMEDIGALHAWSALAAVGMVLVVLAFL